MTGDPFAIDLDALAPAGHYLALRLGFAFPMEEVNHLPSDWIEAYTRGGFMLADPVFRWAYGTTGVTRWSAIDLDDPRGVLPAACRFGLTYGAAVAHLDPGGERSFGHFARPDREYTDVEMSALLGYVRARHCAAMPPDNITKAEIEALRLIKDGKRLKQIAFLLGVTEGAVKQRLKSARAKLEAKTGAEAISRAASFGLI